MALAKVPKPPLQEYEFAPLALKLIEGVLHVICVTPVLFVKVSVGTTVFAVMAMVAVAEQPAVFVTVTV
jgi:hypothetical protein